jgi:hypothetical protein
MENFGGLLPILQQQILKHVTLLFFPFINSRLVSKRINNLIGHMRFEVLTAKMLVLVF